MDYKEQAALIRGFAYEYNKCSCITKIGGMKPEEFLLITATAITDLLARAEAAEKKATELDKALFDAAKVVRTMQERTIPYYRNRTEAAEKEVEWKNKVIEAAERRFVEAEARAEKAERERDAAVSDMEALMWHSGDGCNICAHSVEAHRVPYVRLTCYLKGNCEPKWRGIKEE